jgi:hypothetical protein
MAPPTCVPVIFRAAHGAYHPSGTADAVYLYAPKPRSKTMHRIYNVASIRSNPPEPPSEQRRENDGTAPEEQHGQELPELPDPAEVGESG